MIKKRTVFNHNFTIFYQKPWNITANKGSWEKFYRHLDSHHDPSQFLTDSVTSVMDKNPVIIKANLSLTVICQLITYKKACSFDDFALLADDGYIIGAVPIHLVFLKYINTNIEKGRLL